MGFWSKPKQEETKAKEAEPEDNRAVFTRGFGDKFTEYFNRREEIDSIPWWDRYKRPVRNSSIMRDLAGLQGAYVSIAIFWFVYRKVPFTNPAARVIFFILGIDFCRTRWSYTGILDDQELLELKNFHLMHRQVTTRTLKRRPNFVSEYEDWFTFNKPAYRTPAGYEYTLDVPARFLFVNMHKYGPRNVQWHGEWEQENPLVLDLMSPHNDHWTSIH